MSEKISDFFPENSLYDEELGIGSMPINVMPNSYLGLMILNFLKKCL